MESPGCCHTLHFFSPSFIALFFKRRPVSVTGRAGREEEIWCTRTRCARTKDRRQSPTVVAVADRVHIKGAQALPVMKLVSKRGRENAPLRVKSVSRTYICGSRAPTSLPTFFRPKTNIRSHTAGFRSCISFLSLLIFVVVRFLFVAVSFHCRCLRLQARKRGFARSVATSPPPR